MAVTVEYEASEFYRPGFMTDVGSATVAIIVAVALFILVAVAARYLSRSRRLGPGMRRALRRIGGLTRPVERAPLDPGRYQPPAPRERQEPYRLKAAAAPAGPAPAGSRTTFPEGAERAPHGTAADTDLALLPQEGWPFYAQDEIEAVVDVLRSGKVNQWTGSKVFAFEEAYARAVGNGRAIALANGSVALELALRAFGIGPGDEVIVTPRSFVASAFCVRLVGAAPVFVDIDRDSGAITPESIAAAITPRTRAVIPVHLGGWPADMPAIAALARERGLLVIEDCAQAHGAAIDGLPAGSFADAATFSFCQDKIITTGGEGGLVTFRDDAAFERAWSFKDHGKTRERALRRPTEPGFRWLHDQVGTNWRMTEIAAAIGLLQLEKLPEWHARRTANAAIWADALRAVPGMRVPEPPRNCTPAYYKFYAYVDADPAANRALRDRILALAGERGIRAFSGSCSEMYLEAAFADLEVEPLPVARELGDSSLMFEVHPTLDPHRQRARADAMAGIVRDVLRQG